MRVTTALTTVMFALLIGMLSTPPAEAGAIKKGVVKSGDSVTLCATGIIKDGGTALLTTVPGDKQLVCQNICTGEVGKDVLINGCTQGIKGKEVGDSCAALAPPGQTFGPGDVIFTNDGSKALNVRLDCILTK